MYLLLVRISELQCEVGGNKLTAGSKIAGCWRILTRLIICIVKSF